MSRGPPIYKGRPPLLSLSFNLYHQHPPQATNHPSTDKMKVTTLIATLALGASSALAAALEKYPVPGNTNFHYCNAKAALGNWQIRDLTLQPQKPKKGEPLLITFDMMPNVPKIDNTFNLDVKVGWHTVHHTFKLNPCELGILAENCPTNEFNITKKVDIPGNLPGHKHYTGKIQLKNFNGDEVGCVEGSVDFDM